MLNFDEDACIADPCAATCDSGAAMAEGTCNAINGCIWDSSCR